MTHKIKITEKNKGAVELLKDILEAEAKYGFTAVSHQELLELLKDELKNYRRNE